MALTLPLEYRLRDRRKLYSFLLGLRHGYIHVKNLHSLWTLLTKGPSVPTRTRPCPWLRDTCFQWFRWTYGTEFQLEANIRLGTFKVSTIHIAGVCSLWKYNVRNFWHLRVLFPYPVILRLADLERKRALKRAGKNRPVQGVQFSQLVWV